MTRCLPPARWDASRKTLNTVYERYHAPTDEEGAPGYDPMVRMGE